MYQRLADSGSGRGWEHERLLYLAAFAPIVPTCLHLQVWAHAWVLALFMALFMLKAQQAQQVLGGIKGRGGKEVRGCRGGTYMGERGEGSVLHGSS